MEVGRERSGGGSLARGGDLHRCEVQAEAGSSGQFLIVPPAPDGRS